VRTPKRSPIEPEPKFERMLLKAQQTGQSLKADDITITPPRKGGKYWKLRGWHRGTPYDSSSRDTPADVNAAFIALSFKLEALRNGSVGLPEYGHALLADTIEQYIDQGGPTNSWKGKTPKNRREDFAHLIALSKKEKLKCQDLNAAITRKYLSNATQSGKRAKCLLGVLRTFVDWGIGAGFFTPDQHAVISRVTWIPPKGHNYKLAPTRRQQSKIHYGTSDSAGGEVPTHEQVTQIARELSKRYRHGEALIHISANLGTRANETLIFTASEEVFHQGLGNLVDIDNGVVKVHWQFDNQPHSTGKRVTKNNKFRSVVIPPVHQISTGFDIVQWFRVRCQEALVEQGNGTNPLALIFPSSTGKVINLNSFNSSTMRPTLDALGMKMPAYFDAAGKPRHMYRFTIHSLRDRYGTTAADEWGYSERQLLEQGSWSDPQTVRKFYLGTTDQTYISVKELHATSQPKKAKS
jgi:hypothetical protein